MTIVFEIFEGLPRQGPGDDECTRRAFEMLTDLPAKPEILDVGCGAGTQTIALARLCRGRITATDIYEPFMDELRRRAAAAGVAERVTLMNMPMNELKFPDESFDVIWSEGAIFIIGFEAGLKAWRPLLKPGGYMVVSEATWFVDDPPAEAKAFWDSCYPAITQTRNNVRMAEEAGYTVVGTFPLPAEGWFEFNRPLGPKLALMRKKYAGDAAALAEIAFNEMEIEIFRKYSDAYGYTFFVLRKE
jgi:ubiquinone/menaquinone biosynthesis C-methylase UbiE